MKKNVIAVMLSLVMAVGSVGTVSVFAAEEGSTTEADSEAEETETSVEIVEEEEPEVITEPDDGNKEQSSDDEETTQSDNTQNPGNDNSASETSQDSEESLELDEEQPDDEEDTSVSDEADPAYADYWDNYDYEAEKVEFNGNYYYFRNCGMRNSYGFDQAEAWCEQEGGHLVTINSPEEEAFIRSEIKKIDVLYGFWIGAYRNNTSESWKWINGEKWNYPGTNGSGTSNWPSDAIRIVYWKDGRIIGSSLNPDTDEPQGFICEWEDEKDISKASVTLKDAFQDDEGNNCYEYTGAQIKPGILEVRLGDKTLVNGTDYTAAYGTNLSYGEATVTVKGKGDYKGELVVKFMIVPKKITGLKENNKLSTNTVAYTNYRRGLDLKWDKNPDKTIAFEIQYSKKSDFSNAKTAAVLPGKNTFSAMDEPLERGAEYYVRIRAYKEVNQNHYNGKWSDPIKVKAGNQILVKEMWGFENYTSIISLLDYQQIFKDERGFARSAFEDDYSNETQKDPSTAHETGYTYKSKGVCYGMVFTGVAYYAHNTPSVGSYPKLSSISESMRPGICSSDYSSSLKLENTIIYAHILQYAYQAWTEKCDNINNIYGLYKAVKDCQMEKALPVTVCVYTSNIYTKPDGTVFGAGHRVMAEGIKEETSDRVVIEVYDPILSTVPNELILYKNGSGEFDSWEMYYDVKGNFHGNIGDEAKVSYISYTISDQELVADTLNQLNSEGQASNETFRGFYAQIKNNNPGALDSVKSSAEGQGGISVTKENVLSGEGSIQSAAYFFEKDSIDIPSVPAGCTLTFANGNHFARVSPTAVSDVHLKVLDSKSSEITVTPHGKGKCTISLFDAEAMPSDYDEFTTIEGDMVSGKIMRIGQDGNSIDITGMDSVSISKTGGNEDENGGISEDLTISVGADLNLDKSYRFTHDDDKAKIVQDKDGNGEYETVISESEVGTSGPKTLSGTIETGLFWELNPDGILSIYGEGSIPDYYSEVAAEEDNQMVDESPWYDYRDSIKEVCIGEGITEIGHHAFTQYENLERVEFPDSLETVGKGAFQNCFSLKEINWGEGLRVIEDYAFNYCNSLKEIIIPDGVEYIGAYALAWSDGLEKAVLPDSVEEAGMNLFAESPMLRSVKLGSGMKELPQGIFYKCTSLISITIPDGVTSIGPCAFENCSRLEQVTLPRNIKTIEEYAFKDCSKLKATVKNKYGLTYCKDNKIPYIDRSAIEIKLTSYNGSDFRVNITKRDDASGYQIKYADNSSMTNAKSVMLKGSNNLSKVITGLKNGKTYYVKIQSYQTINGTTYWSNWSPAKSIKITQTPYNTNVSKLSTYIGSHIKVDWTKTAGASGYHIKYADNSGMTGAKEVFVKGNSTFTKTLTGLKNGKTYYVKIQTYRTVSGKTYWSSWSPAKSIKVDQKPYGLSIKKLTPESGGKVKVVWNKSPGASGYHIQYRWYDSNKKKYVTKDIIVNGNGTLSKTITGLIPKRDYYIRIQTFRKASGKTYWSSWSQETRFWIWTR